MKKIVLIAALLLAVPAAAHDHHTCHSGDSSFEVEDGRLVITRDRFGSDDEVIVSREGDLEINGERIDVDKSQRAHLKKFYREADKLERMAAEIGEDAGQIAEASTAYAIAQVASALRSLGDDDADADEADMADIESDFAKQMEKIEGFADEIEEQAEKVVDMADDLQQEIPALGKLDWFLDD